MFHFRNCCKKVTGWMQETSSLFCTGWALLSLALWHGCEGSPITLTTSRSFYLTWTPTLPSGAISQSHQWSHAFSDHCFLWACLCPCEVWTKVCFSRGLTLPSPAIIALCLTHMTCFIKTTHLTVVLSNCPCPRPGSSLPTTVCRSHSDHHLFL